MTTIQLQALGVIAASIAVGLAATIFYWPLRRAERRLEQWSGLPQWSDRAERILRIATLALSIIGIGVGLFGLVVEKIVEKILAD
jgi:hypothetical protein